MTLFFNNKPTTIKPGDKLIHDSAAGTFLVKRKERFLRFANGEMATYSTEYFDDREKLKSTMLFVANCAGLQLSDDYKDSGRVVSVTFKAPSKTPKLSDK